MIGKTFYTLNYVSIQVTLGKFLKDFRFNYINVVYLDVGLSYFIGARTSWYFSRSWKTWFIFCWTIDHTGTRWLVIIVEVEVVTNFRFPSRSFIPSNTIYYYDVDSLYQARVKFYFYFITSMWTQKRKNKTNDHWFNI